MMERKYDFSKNMHVILRSQCYQPWQMGCGIHLGAGTAFIHTHFWCKNSDADGGASRNCLPLPLYVLLNTLGIAGVTDVLKSKLYGCYKQSLHSLVLQRQPFRLAFSLDTLQWESPIKRVATIVFTCKICSRQAKGMSITCLH